MTRWDDLLAVQEHDTTIDQLVHRRAHLPSRAELDEVMAELAGLEASAAEVEDDAPRARARPAAARGRDRLAQRAGEPPRQDALQRHDRQPPRAPVAPGRDRLAQAAHLPARGPGARGHGADRAARRAARRPSPRRGRPSTSAAAPSARRSPRRRWRSTPSSSRCAGSATRWPAPSTPSSSPSTTSCGSAPAASPSPGMVGGSCGGCHLSLSAVDVDRIKKLPPEAPAYCEECGRLLAR